MFFFLRIFSHFLCSRLKSKQSEQDKELIQHLSDQVAKTTSLNLDLTTKLKISEGEIESYKKILIDYQNQLSEMKVKHINEASRYVRQDLEKTLFFVCLFVFYTLFERIFFLI